MNNLASSMTALTRVQVPGFLRDIWLLEKKVSNLDLFSKADSGTPLFISHLQQLGTELKNAIKFGKDYDNNLKAIKKAQENIGGVTVANLMPDSSEFAQTYNRLLDEFKTNSMNFEGALQDVGENIVYLGQDFAEFAGKLKQIAVAAVEAASKITILAVALGAVASIKNALSRSEVLDSYDEESQKVMMTSTAYQQWAYVLQMTGASTSTLKTAMRGLNKAVTSSNSAFQQLGITTEEVASMDREDLFAETIKRIQNLGTAEEKAAVASELFGSRAFSDLMPLLNQTNGDVQKLIQTYEALGLEMGSNYTTSAAKLQDSLDLLKMSFEGLKNTLAVKIIPVLQKVVEWLTVAVTAVSYFFKVLLGVTNSLDDVESSDATDNISSGLSSAADSAKELKRQLMGFDELNVLSDDSSSSSGVSVDTSDFDTSGISNLAVLSDEALEKIRNIKTTLDEIGPKLQTWVPILTMIAGLVMIIVGAISGSLPLAIAGVAVLLTGLTIGIANDFGGLGETIRGIFSEVGEFIGGVWDNISEWFSQKWEAFKQIPIVAFFVSMFTAIKEQLSGVITVIVSSITKIASKCWEILSTIIQIVVAIGKAVYTYAIKPVIDFFAGLYNKYVKPVVDKIRSVLQTVGTAVGNFIGGAIKSVINAVLNLIENRINTFIRLLNGAVSIINKIPGVNISKVTQISLPRLATGGIATRSTIAEIGENGKEAILPLENNTEWMYKLASIINADRGSQDVRVDVDGKNLFDIVVARNNQTVNRTGRSPIVV